MKIRNPFKKGQLVEFLKDFPSVGAKKGDRLPVASTSYGLTPDKTCPKGVKPACGFKEYPTGRFPIEFLKAAELEKHDPT